MGVQRRNIVLKPQRKFLKPARGQRRPAPPRMRAAVVKLETPPISKATWRLTDPRNSRAWRAVQIADELFARRYADAVLGWLFSRFPEMGQMGDDMVDHHAALSDDTYYTTWAVFCRRLGLRL